MMNNLKIQRKINAHQTNKLNTARSSSREFCLKIFLPYEWILNVLEIVSLEILFEENL